MSRKKALQRLSRSSASLLALGFSFTYHEDLRMPIYFSNCRPSSTKSDMRGGDLEMRASMSLRKMWLSSASSSSNSSTLRWQCTRRTALSIRGWCKEHLVGTSAQRAMSHQGLDRGSSSYHDTHTPPCSDPHFPFNRTFLPSSRIPNPLFPPKPVIHPFPTHPSHRVAESRPSESILPRNRFPASLGKPLHAMVSPMAHNDSRLRSHLF